MTTTTYPAHEVVETFTVWAHLDNHNPSREYFRGEVRVLEPTKRNVKKTWVLIANDAFLKRIENGPKPIFLLDDGKTVIPLYISGWSIRGEVWLHNFPVNPDGETRPDGRVIDYSTWALGPRLAYHLKAHE